MQESPLHGSYKQNKSYVRLQLSLITKLQATHNIWLDLVCACVCGGWWCVCVGFECVCVCVCVCVCACVCVCKCVNVCFPLFAC